MMVSSTTGPSRLGAFLGIIFAVVFRGRFLGVARFATLLREGLPLTLPRLPLFLLVAVRFFALAMAVSYECRQRINLDAGLPRLWLNNSSGHFYPVARGWSLALGNLPNTFLLLGSIIPNF
jgi:hypothetical protein